MSDTKHSINEILLGNKDMKQKLDRLTKYCHSELYSMDICSECFRNANESTDSWFTKVCEYPHLLVWARMSTKSSFWPAKAMAIKKCKGEDRIHVTFFSEKTGEEPNAYVSQSNCFLFSLNKPKGQHANANEELMNSSMEVRLI